MDVRDLFRQGRASMLGFAAAAGSMIVVSMASAPGDECVYVTSCNAGDTMTGGGYSQVTVTTIGSVTASEPVAPDGWKVTVRNTSSTNQGALTTYVVCVH